MRPLDPAVMRYDPVALIADLGLGRLACAERLERTVTNLALLKSVVPDFPVASLASVRATDGAAAGRVAFADADWAAIGALNEEGVRLARAGRIREALALLERSLAAAGDQLHVLAGIATLRGEVGDHEAALAAWRRVEALAPGDPEAAAGIERSLAALGR
jgi:tetratricopeptide (TPR) repeat protein